MTATEVAMVTAAVEMAAAVALFRRGRSNALVAAFPADGVTRQAAASATIAASQRLRHQHHADLPAAAYIWLYWDRAVATGSKSPLAPLPTLPLFPSSCTK